MKAGSIITLALFTTTACTSLPRREIAEVSNPHNTFTSSSVECEAKNCLSGVGLLSIALEKSGSLSTMNAQNPDLGFCTGFLIAPDVVMTNGHCLPKDLRTIGASCRDRMGFTLPNSEAVHCSKVLAFYEKTRNQTPGESWLEPDYALLQLDRRLQFPLEVNNSGFQNNEKLDVWVVKRISADSFKAKLSKFQCEIQYAPEILPQFKSSNFPFPFLARCPTLPGHSGAPATVPGTNKVKAVVMIGQIQKTGPRSPLTFHFPKEPFSFATALFAIEILSSDYSQSSYRKEFSRAEKIQVTPIVDGPP